MRAITVFFLIMTAATHAADTAYSALRLLGAQRGEESLEHVVGLRGSKDTWKILLTDSKARTGAREIQVRGGRIIRDASIPKPDDITPPLNLSLLNLDSDGALMAMNQQAPRALTADEVDYALANNDRNIPVWTLKSREPDGASGPPVQIAADTGEVISQSEIPGIARDAVAADRNAAPDKNAVSERNAAADRDFAADRNAASDRDAASEDREPPTAGPRKKIAAQPFRPRSSDVPETVKRTVDEVERGVRRIKRLLPF